MQYTGFQQSYLQSSDFSSEFKKQSLYVHGHPPFLLGFDTPTKTLPLKPPHMCMCDGKASNEGANNSI